MYTAITFAVVLTTLPLLLHGVKWGGKVEISPGLVAEQLDLPSVYETFVPIILEFKRSAVNSTSLSTEGIFLRNCTSNEYIPDSPCPTAFFIKEEVQRFFKYFSDSQQAPSTFPTKYGQTYNWNDIDETFNIFQSPFANDDAVNQHITQLVENAPLNVFYVERNNTNYSTVNIGNIQKMMRGYYEQFWTEVSSDRVDDALYANAISLYQAMITQQHIMEVVRWNRVMEECANFKIPRSFITEEKLATILTSLRQNLTSQSYDLTMAVENIGQYYLQKLTSCVTTPNAVFVTIRVPVSNIKTMNISNLEFFRVHSIPFLTPKSENNGSQALCQVKAATDTYYLRDMRLGYVQASKCKPLQLCPLPKEWYFGVNDPCLSAVRELKGQDIASYCTMICNPVESLQLQRFPLVKQVSTLEYYLTGKTDGTLIKCGPKHGTMRLPVHTIGSLRFQIHAQCRVMVDQEMPREAIKTVPTATVVIPVHWTVNKAMAETTDVDLDLQGLLPNVQNTAGIMNTDARSYSGVPRSAQVTSSQSTNALEIVWFSVLTIGLVGGLVYVFVFMRKLRTVAFDTYSRPVQYLNGPHASEHLINEYGN